MRSLVDSLRAEEYDVEFYEPDGDDPLGGVIDVSGPFGLVQIISFEDRFPAVIRETCRKYRLRGLDDLLENFRHFP